MNRLANVLVFAGTGVMSGAAVAVWLLFTDGRFEFWNVALGLYVSFSLVGIGAASIAIGVFVRLLPSRSGRGFEVEVELTTGKTPVLLIKEDNHG